MKICIVLLLYYVVVLFVIIVYTLCGGPGAVASDRQGSNCFFGGRGAVSSYSSHHPQEELLAQFSLYVHKGGLKLHSFSFILCTIYFVFLYVSRLYVYVRTGLDIMYLLNVL